MKIYVGNLSSETNAAQLRTMFEPHGVVKRARLATDKETGEPRGFGYVEMDDEPARAAIAALHATRAGGQRLKVRQARKRAARPAEGENGRGNPAGPSRQ